MGQLRARIEEVRRVNERKQEALEADLLDVPGHGQICPDCGIDLPTMWHWDGCPYGGVASELIDLPFVSVHV